jgi:hypothetical protein
MAAAVIPGVCLIGGIKRAGAAREAVAPQRLQSQHQAGSCPRKHLEKTNLTTLPLGVKQTLPLPYKK